MPSDIVRAAAARSTGLRRRVRSRIVLVAATVAAAGLALAGCSNPGATQGGGGSVPADGTAKVQSKQLTVWVNPSDPKAVMNVYKRYTKETGVTFNIVEMPTNGFESGVNTRWASGERPDLLEYHATSLFWSLNPAQNLYDLSNMPYTKREAEILKSAARYQGKVYGAITDSPSLFGLFYNRSALADNGLEAPKTFKDLETICTTLKAKDPGVVPIWESGGSSWPTQILSLMYMSSAQKTDAWDQRVLTKKTTFDAKGSPFVAALTEYKKLQTMGCYNSDATTAKFEDGIPAITTGKAAMMALPTGLLDMFNDQLGGDAAKTAQTIGFAYPSADGAVSVWAPNVGGTWYVPKTGNAKKESTALNFIQWATTKGYQDFVDEEGTFPILDGAKPPAAGYTGVNKEIVNAYQTSTAFAFNSNLSGFNAQFNNYTTGLLSGTETPQSIAAKSQTVFSQAAKAAKLPGWK